MSADGTVRPLISLFLKLPFKYCPQDTTTFGFLFDAVTKQDLVSYCPQGSNGFYSFALSFGPQQTLSNYCPQDITNFYSFTQSP